MKKVKYIILSILSVLSGIWSTALLVVIGQHPMFYGLSGTEENRRSLILLAIIYGLTLLYDVWAFLDCKNANQKEEIEKGYYIATIIGLIIFAVVSVICTFAIVIVSITGGA